MNGSGCRCGMYDTEGATSIEALQSPPGTPNMAGMYEVYSQQRPGHPRWALGASAILLLLTVALAAALIQYKSGFGNVPLQPFTSSGLEGALPTGWQDLQGELPEGTLLAVAEPGEGRQPGRQLFIFARLPLPLLRHPTEFANATAEAYAMEALSQNVPSSGEMKVQRSPGGSVEQVDDLRAIGVLVRLSPPKNAPPWYCLVRTAIVPPGLGLRPGCAIGVALLTRGELSKADIRLLDRVSRELRIAGPSQGADPGERDDSTGISADIEAGPGCRV
jgi:hypothetical protein